MRNNLPIINVYKKKSIKSKLSTQLLYGETFKILKKDKPWLKIKNDQDNYHGFIKEKKFPANQKSTHKVSSLSAKVYSRPGVKIKMKLSFGSKIKVIENKKNFYKFDNYWINKKDIKKINYKSKNIFKHIKNDKTIFEKDCLPKLVSKKQLIAFKHHGFWACMDTIREKNELNKIWKSKQKAWKVWL